MPVFEYSHAELGGGAAAIGGFLYKDVNNNEYMRGRYLGAHLYGHMFLITPTASGAWDSERIGFQCSAESNGL